MILSTKRHSLYYTKVKAQLIPRSLVRIAIRLMTPCCFMTSIDLKDAYYSVPIADEHQKYLKFLWRDQLYAFTCLPMGLTSSPRIFTKILKPVFATLRSKFGHSCLGYIDDSLNLGDTYTEAEKATLHAVELLISLGFMIHPEKSIITPTQIIEFLGFVLNSILMIVKLTDRKAEKIMKLCIHFCHKGIAFTIREVASLIGSLIQFKLPRGRIWPPSLPQYRAG